MESADVFELLVFIPRIKARISSIVSQPGQPSSGSIASKHADEYIFLLRRACEKSEFQAPRSTHRWPARIVSRRRCRASDSRRILSASARRSPAETQVGVEPKDEIHILPRFARKELHDHRFAAGLPRTILREMYRLDPAVLPRGLVEDFRGAIARAVIDDNPALRQARLRRHAGNQSGAGRHGRRPAAPDAAGASRHAGRVHRRARGDHALAALALHEPGHRDLQHARRLHPEGRLLATRVGRPRPQQPTARPAEQHALLRRHPADLPSRCLFGDERPQPPEQPRRPASRRCPTTTRTSRTSPPTASGRSRASRPASSWSWPQPSSWSPR